MKPMVITIVCLLLLPFLGENSALAFLGIPSNSRLYTESVKQAEVVLAGRVVSCQELVPGVAQIYTVTYTGTWFEATVAVDHILKGAPPAQVRVDFFRPANGMDTIAFDSLDVGRRYVMCLGPKQVTNAVYIFIAAAGSNLETMDTPPTENLTAHSFSEHLESELMPLIRGKDILKRVRAINSVAALPTRSPKLLEELDAATQDPDPSVKSAAQRVTKYLKEHPTGPQ